MNQLDALKYFYVFLLFFLLNKKLFWIFLLAVIMDKTFPSKFNITKNRFPNKIYILKHIEAYKTVTEIGILWRFSYSTKIYI